MNQDAYNLTLLCRMVKQADGYTGPMMGLGAMAGGVAYPLLHQILTGQKKDRLQKALIGAALGGAMGGGSGHFMNRGDGNLLKGMQGAWGDFWDPHNVNIGGITRNRLDEIIGDTK